jgi:hypothetical protein
MEEDECVLSSMKHCTRNLQCNTAGVILVPTSILADFCDTTRISQTWVSSAEPAFLVAQQIRRSMLAYRRRFLQNCKRFFRHFSGEG